MNLVVGATGVLGGEICRQLRQAGKPVRALTPPALALIVAAGVKVNLQCVRGI
jgi:uncharacterized protein YbjT (DUF2867 family)